MPKFILSLIFICLTSQMWSQIDQQEKLEKRKVQIQEEIRENELLLKDAKKKEKSVSNLIAIQSDKIKLKVKLINTTEKQAKLIGNDMYSNQMQINKLKKELVILKEDYAKMIVKSYKSRSSQSRAMFLLSSENFLQAYKRAQYMKQYTSYRKMQGEEIKEKTEQITAFNKKLTIQKSDKEKLIEESEKDRLALQKVKLEQEILVNSIKKDKRQLTADIKNKQKEYAAIDKQIKKLIREAIAEANRRAAAEAAKANPKTTTAASTRATESSSKIVLTPEGKIISDNFKANKGHLPWPVEKGFISLGFGKQPHPIHHSLVINNSGIDISTIQGAEAIAVFGGEVASIMVLSPVSKIVMIRHGDFFTVYQNLSNVYVTVGDKVTLKQPIGKVRTDGEGKTVIKFAISQNDNGTDPTYWLSRM